MAHQRVAVKDRKIHLSQGRNHPSESKLVSSVGMEEGGLILEGLVSVRSVWVASAVAHNNEAIFLARKKYLLKTKESP
jgi:hypothetical protein